MRLCPFAASESFPGGYGIRPYGRGRRPRRPGPFVAAEKLLRANNVRPYNPIKKTAARSGIVPGRAAVILILLHQPTYQLCIGNGVLNGQTGNQQGLVILQTSQPDSPVIQQVVRHDYRAFYDQLFEERRLFRYPPFTHLTYIYLKHRQERTVESASMEMGSRLRQIFGDRVLGPDKPSVARVKTLHIRKLMLKLELGIDLRRVRQCLREVQSAMLQAKTYGALQIYYDVDPL